MTKKTLAAAVCMTSTLITGAVFGQSLTVSNGLSPKHYVSTGGFEPWMECVKAGTKDGLDFNYFPGGTIAPVKETIDALESGLPGTLSF